MKNRITLAFSALLLSATLVNGQRYLQETFTDAEITVVSEQVYGINFSQYVPASLGGPQLIPQFYDVYMPDPAIDTESARPVIVYLHTGSFLPKGLASPMGEKTDSAAVEFCRRFARMGYVAVSASYRVGWLANSTDLDLRRGTNLMAVYNAVQDAKACVRTLNGLQLGGGNPYATNMTHVALVGQGSGGYITFAYSALDRVEETTIPTKFQYSQSGTGIYGNPVNANDPYVDTALVGDWNGFGGTVTLTGNTTPLGLPEIDLTATGRNYENGAGLPDEVSVVVNLGGAVGDSSWIEAGELPMVSVHCRNDFYAPYYRGMVQVPVAGAFFPVVEVVGSHTAIKMSDDFGTNAVFYNANFNDDLSLASRNNRYNLGNYEALLTFNIEAADPQLPFRINSNPWDFWDPADPLSVNETNPNVKATSMAYIDTVMGFITPRIAYIFKQDGLNVPGLSEEELNAPNENIVIFPNPASRNVTIQTSEDMISLMILDLTGKEVANFAPNSSEVVVNVENLRSGVYLVAVRTESGTNFRKLNVTTQK